MGREVKLSRMESVLGELSYPITREDAATQFEDVTLLHANGEMNLGKLVADTSSEEYESVDDISTEIENQMPRDAVGEPYQSEGEG